MCKANKVVSLTKLLCWIGLPEATLLLSLNWKVNFGEKTKLYNVYRFKLDQAKYLFQFTFFIFKWGNVIWKFQRWLDFTQKMTHFYFEDDQPFVTKPKKIMPMWSALSGLPPSRLTILTLPQELQECCSWSIILSGASG